MGKKIALDGYNLTLMRGLNQGRKRTKSRMAWFRDARFLQRNFYALFAALFTQASSVEKQN
jgi:hypothetical protein